VAGILAYYSFGSESPLCRNYDLSGDSNYTTQSGVEIAGLAAVVPDTTIDGHKTFRRSRVNVSIVNYHKFVASAIRRIDQWHEKVIGRNLFVIHACGRKIYDTRLIWSQSHKWRL